MRITIVATTVVMFMLGQAVQDPSPADDSTSPPTPLAYEQDFSESTAISQFEFSDPSAWRIHTAEDGAAALELFGGGDYKPPHRSPRSIALIAGSEFSDFVLEADLLQTGREYGHRDMCIFFGFKDPSHFYYVHLASKADENAHNIFVVDDAPRTKIASSTSKGIQWGQDTWHHIRLEREADTVKVFFDDMTKPIMIARDKRFAEGGVGFGSFDDTGRIDNIRIRSDTVRPRAGKFFEQTPASEVRQPGFQSDTGFGSGARRARVEFPVVSQ